MVSDVSSVHHPDAMPYLCANADNMNVSIDGLLSDLLRRRKQGSNVYIKANVSKARGNHLSHGKKKRGQGLGRVLACTCSQL